MRQLMYSFDGTTAPPPILDAVRRGEIVSFCLFAHRNVESPAQVRALTDSLIRAAAEGGDAPPLIGIDQEGGQLMAITGGATELPGNMALGATGSPELARDAGRVLARELLAMGINLNFAPSVDVNRDPRNPVIGSRAFGDDPTCVGRLGAALIHGLQSENVIAVAKHFPGHGDTHVDSHHGVPVVTHSLDELQAIDLQPFRAAIKARVGAIMSAHVVYDALDCTRPATLSNVIMTGLLRNALGFDGLILTDAMDMHAVARHGAAHAVDLALRAGADIAVLANLPDHLSLTRQITARERPDAIARIDAARARLPRELPPLSIVGCAEHRQIARTIAEAAITLVNDDGQLPLRPHDDALIAVITPTPADLTPADTSSAVTIQLADAIQRRHRRVQGYTLPRHATDGQIAALVNAVGDAERVIVGTICAERDPAQTALVHALIARGVQPIVVSMRTPYDIAAFPNIQTYLCSYSIRPAAIEAAARVLFGEIAARGVVPCALMERLPAEVAVQ
jgi:beta-N-acetylhexosaminidase